jgi:hypothetical protein
MAIIRYQLDNGNIPSYITDGGYFNDPSDGTKIGIGSGGGTELTSAELLTYIKEMDARKITFFDNLEQSMATAAGTAFTSERAAKTDSEYETIRDAWLSQKGIS